MKARRGTGKVRLSAQKAVLEGSAHSRHSTNLFVHDKTLHKPLNSHSRIPTHHRLQDTHATLFYRTACKLSHTWLICTHWPVLPSPRRPALASDVWCSFVVIYSYQISDQPRQRALTDELSPGRYRDEHAAVLITTRDVRTCPVLFHWRTLLPRPSSASPGHTLRQMIQALRP